MWGGLLVYFALAAPAALVLTRQRLDALDLTALTLPIPGIMAKLGCFFNGCCHGKPCSLPWAITFPEAAGTAPPGVSLHPTQLYEIVLMLAILIVFSILRAPARRGWRGAKLWWFLLLYGVGRAVTDFLRGDAGAPPLLGPLTLTQVICFVAAGAALLALISVRRWSAQ